MEVRATASILPWSVRRSASMPPPQSAEADFDPSRSRSPPSRLREREGEGSRSAVLCTSSPTAARVDLSHQGEAIARAGEGNLMRTFDQ